MPIRKILQLGNPKLREKCAPLNQVDKPGTAALIEDLRDTLAHARATTKYGRGIAAPQIGVLERVVFIKLPEAPPGLSEFGRGVALINPEIVDRSKENILVWDACLSFLSIFMQVERHKNITVRYTDAAGQQRELEAGAACDLSELLQHEIDHLDGILCIDRVKDLKSVVTKEEFEARYRMDSPYATKAK